MSGAEVGPSAEPTRLHWRVHYVMPDKVRNSEAALVGRSPIDSILSDELEQISDPALREQLAQQRQDLITDNPEITVPLASAERIYKPQQPSPYQEHDERRTYTMHRHVYDAYFGLNAAAEVIADEQPKETANRAGSIARLFGRNRK